MDYQQVILVEISTTKQLTMGDNFTYLDLQEMEDRGLVETRNEGVRTTPLGRSYVTTGASYATRGTSARDAYWRDNAPVMIKFEFNGETIMLPKMAPKDEKQVTVRKTILDRIVSVIRNHSGSYRIDWNWRTHCFESHTQDVLPGLITMAEQLLPTLKIFTTPQLYTFADAKLLGTDAQTELALVDATDANAILADSRRDGRWISVTLTFDPRRITPQGTNLIRANQLPTSSQIVAYFRVPQDAGGVHANITRDMIENHPEQILGIFPDIVFMAISRGTTPLTNTFDTWMNDQWNHVIFESAVQLATKQYVGAEVATESLRQRLNRLNQREWDPVTKKNRYFTVSELGTRYYKLLNETKGMTADAIARELMELDVLFFNALVPRLKEKTSLAELTNHAPSANLGENITHLQAMIEAAKEAEKEVNQIVAISSSNRAGFQRTGVTGANTTAAATGNAFMATQMVDQGQVDGTQVGGNDGTVGATTGTAASALVAAPAPAQDELTGHYVTLLSNAERALRGSSNMNAPLECWGCKGFYQPNDHVYKDCPHKKDSRVQQQFQAKLEEFLAKKRKFDPNKYKTDGFASKNAATMLNSIINSSTDGHTRKVLINEFIVETQMHSEGRSTRQRTTDAIEGGSATTQHSTAETNSTGEPRIFVTWLKNGVFEMSQEDTNGVRSFQFSPGPGSFTFRYPISNDMPHVNIPVGRQGQALIEGLLDTGGACTMGDLIYWQAVCDRMPELVAHFDKLEVHSEQPIAIGGVGPGSVHITHVMGVWLPWVVSGQDSKLLIGLGDNMPVTLLIGLPFQINAQVTIDVANEKCYSAVFGTTWKMTMKPPHKKTLRTLDSIMSSGTAAKRLSLLGPSRPISPSPKKQKVEPKKATLVEPKKVEFATKLSMIPAPDIDQLQE